MWPFDRRRADLDAIAAMKDVSLAQAKAAQAQAEAQTALAVALQAWIGSFVTQKEGESFVTRVEDEVAAEQARNEQALREAGFPVGGSPAQQDAWLLSLMEKGI